MIEVRDLAFRFTDSDFKLELHELDIQAGEQVAIVGPSGSGKTTLLNLIAGILVPSSGGIRVQNVEVSTLDESARRAFRVQRIGLVFQEFELLEYLSVRENILLPYRINRRLKLDTAAQAEADRLVAKTGLGNLTARFPKQLSHGERQRVALCRALVHRPQVVLADEPTGSLDPANKLSVLDLLLQHARSSKAALLMVTHDHALLDRFDRVIELPQTTLHLS